MTATSPARTGTAHDNPADPQTGPIPLAVLIGKLSAPDGTDLLLLRDPLANALYAIETSFVEQVVVDSDSPISTSPYGHRLDLSDVADQATEGGDRPAPIPACTAPKH